MAYTTLKDWMDAKDKKDADVAALVGISRSQITRIRTGVSNPGRNTARKLEEVTKIPAARFVMGLAASPKEASSAAA